jgi:glycerol-3-phosphate O-acyltransferase/dihydroxyacetone phosphate acyltransferase
MLYNLLKLLFRITFKFFFRKTFRMHPERLPESGPLIICANHPGAFLDPIVIAASTKRRIYFLAKAAVFKGAIAKWLLPKFNMIPVYRKQDDPTQMHKNDETFAKCYEHLLRGDAILIFPEGVSITERKLKEIKTGAARIALGACAASGFKQDVKIACLGINYDDPHIFRQDVLLSYSEPVSVLNYRSEYESDSFKAAQLVTDAIRERLEGEVIHIEHEEADGITRMIEKLYRSEIVGDKIQTAELKVRELEMIRNISTAVRYFLHNDRDRVTDVVNKVKSYFWKLEELGFTDKLVRSGRKNGSRYFYWLGELALMIFGFPLFIYGSLANYLPFYAASFLSRKLVKQREFFGAIGVAAGMLFFLIWYILLIIVLRYFQFVWWIDLLIISSWIPTGLWSWFYMRSLYYISNRWKYITVLRTHKGLMSDITQQRQEIIDEFKSIAEKLRADGIIPPA